MDLSEPFAAAGVRGFVHAVALDGGRETGLDPDAPVMPASTFKVLVALAAERAFAAGRLDPTERVRVTDTNRTTGPVGMSLFRDEVELSLGDLLVPMLTVSDNVATDLLIDRLGLEELAATATGLGLGGTVVGCDLRTLIDSIAVDAGFADWAAVEAWEPPDASAEAALQRRIRAARALRPDGPLHSTARDLTTVLRAVWSEEAGERLRFLMARQVGRDRLARGLGEGTSLAAKSGSLFGVWRNEIGVVTVRDGRAVAVAVLTHAPDGGADEQAVGAAIGDAAARAVADVLGSLP
jgi:beta-lactamase class A